MSYKEQEILQWATDRNILGANGQGTPEGQLKKTREETEEIQEGIDEHDIDKIRDGIGDVYVTIAIQAAMHGLSMNECIDRAWNDIKDRTGMMIQGKFVKQSDLDLLSRAGWENYAGKMCAKARSADQRDQLISAAVAVDLAPESSFTLEELGGKKYWGLTL